MLLIGAFAIYVIIRKRVRITRNFMLTGQRARNFGICLLLLVLPLSMMINRMLDALPGSFGQNPIAANIFAFVVFVAVTFSVAVLFRKSHA